MTKNTHAFRLSAKAGKGPASTCVFESTRTGFRTQLASALIDLRQLVPLAPLRLEIGRDRGNGYTWVGLPQKHFPGGHLPELVRWESASDLYDHLVREMTAATEPEREQGKPSTAWA